MDLVLTEEQQLFKRTIREFMDRECPREYVRELDEKQQYPYELYDKWVKMGWLGLPFPEEYGGSNASVMDMIILAEGIGCRGYDLATPYALCVFVGTNVLRHGTAEQKAHYLPRVIDGRVRFAISITEPNSGSDAASIVTSAVEDGDDFVINGQKTFQTAAHARDTVMIMLVRTDPKAPKHKGLSTLLVPNDRPGIEIRRINMLGRRIAGTNEVFLDNVRVPRGNLLGGLNNGWHVLMGNLEIERLFDSALYIGNGQEIVDYALQYAKERQQFGQAIGKFQAISHMLVDMQVEIEAARLLVYRGASMIDHKLPCFKEVCMAKLFGSEAMIRAANLGMQIMGGYGYVMEYHMQRYFRDARIATVAAGTSQIQRNIIAKAMGL